MLLGEARFAALYKTDCKNSFGLGREIYSHLRSARANVMGRSINQRAFTPSHSLHPIVPRSGQEEAVESYR